MLELGRDILEHNVFPLLHFADIVALRGVCKRLYAAIEGSDGWKWDRRYYEDFPFDARRLQGNGFERYSRRSRARLVLDGLSDGYGDYEESSLSQDPVLLAAIAAEPIVDMIFFDCDNRGSNYGSWHSDCWGGDGVLVRRLDGSLNVYTAQGVRAVLNTADVSGIHCFRFTDWPYNVLFGWRHGKLVSYKLDDLVLVPSLFDEAGAALGKALDERKAIAFSDTDLGLAGPDLDLFREWEALPDAPTPTRLREMPSSLYYRHTKIDCEKEARRTDASDSYGLLVANLRKEFPVRLDIVVPSALEPLPGRDNWEPFAVAAAAGCNLFVLGYTQQQPGHEVYKKYSFALPHKIVALIAKEDLCVLDDKGNVYAGRLYFSSDGEVIVSEPKLVLQNAVQLVGSDIIYDKVRALMSDGTVKYVCGHRVRLESPDGAPASRGRVEYAPGEATGVENAILIDGVLNLVVDGSSRGL